MQDQEREADPICLYIIVRESLNMSIGKTAAQACHAVQYIMVKYFELKEESKSLLKRIQLETDETIIKTMQTSYSDIGRKISIMGEWLHSAVRKVVLKASEKEWEAVKAENKDCIIVTDAGYTELEPGTDTVIGLWPARKSNRSKTVKRLQAL